MAKLPKMQYNGKPVNTLKINGVETYNAKKNDVPVFHKHVMNVCVFSGIPVKCGKRYELVYDREKCRDNTYHWDSSSNQWRCNTCNTGAGYYNGPNSSPPTSGCGGYNTVGSHYACPEHGGNGSNGETCQVIISPTQQITVSTQCGNTRRKHLEYSGGKWWIQIDYCQKCGEAAYSGGEGYYTDHPPTVGELSPANPVTYVSCGHTTTSTQTVYGTTYKCGFDAN